MGLVDIYIKNKMKNVHLLITSLFRCCKLVWRKYQRYAPMTPYKSF